MAHLHSPASIVYSFLCGEPAMQRLRLSVPVLIAFLSCDPVAADPPTFEKDVLPIFRTHCVKCHGADKQKADLDMRSKAALLKGGESGPALQPGTAQKSLLWEKVAADKMPPGKEKLTAEQKA